MTGYDAAREIFSIVDLLQDQAMLRRALSDPSAGAEQRKALLHQLLDGKVGSEALLAAESVVGESWRSASDMVQSVERSGVAVALRAAQEEGSLDRVMHELHTVSQAVGQSVDLGAVLRGSGYSSEAKRDLLAKIMGTEVHPVAALLAQRCITGPRRTFSQNAAEYLQLAAEISQRAIATVTVARPLDRSREDRLRQALSQRVGKPVTLQVVVDPQVLGGLNVSIGHEVYESTVAGRLEEVRRQLTNS